MAPARGARYSTTSAIDAEIDGWVKSELAKPAAQKDLTRHQVQVIRSVFANHEALKTKTG